MDTGELTAGRPLPEIGDRTRPFWDAVADHRLVIQYCDACSRWLHPPLPLCPSCGRPDPGWRQVSGDGVVSAFTVVHRPPLPVFDPPYVIAMVELEDVPVRVLSNVIGREPSAVHIGLPVRVTFRAVGDRSLYFFAPRDGSDD